MEKKEFIQDEIAKMKDIEENIINYLDNEEEEEVNFQLLIQFLNNLEIQKNKSNLKTVFHFISHISSNHYRSRNFFSKIERILSSYQESIKNCLTNSEIFNIFKQSKRILLFLFDKKILIPDKLIFKKISNFRDKKKKDSYFKYFNEYKPIFKEFTQSNDIFDIFSFFFGNVKEEEEEEEDPLYDQKRKIGENDIEICELIRNDSIKEFVSYVTRTNFPLSTRIKESIYETNSFLINKRPTLIEYAAFFGAIQIFQYLKLNKIELTSSLWNYSIHGRKPEIIHLLEEYKVEPDDKTFEKCLKKSIKFHHNEISNYIIDNLINKNKSEVDLTCLKSSIKSYNFTFLYSLKIEEIFNNINDIIFDLCKYDYISLVDFFVKTKRIDLNEKNESKKVIPKEKNDDKTDLEGLLDQMTVDEQYSELEQEKTILFIATEEENIEIIELLLSQQEIDVNSQSTIAMNEVFGECEGTSSKNIDTSINIAVNLQNIPIIKLFLSHPNIDVNSISKNIESGGYSESTRESSLLIDAIALDNLEIVDLLLKHPKIDIESKNIRDTCVYEKYQRKKEEISALGYAVRYKQYEIARLLLSKKNIDVNSKYLEISYTRDENWDYTIIIFHLKNQYYLLQSEIMILKWLNFC